ncbi:MAG: hypothetical protein RLZZ241_2483 [Bacteroidota bacterium]
MPDSLKIYPIQTKNLGIGYRTQKSNIELLQGLNISLPEGSLTAVVGINGAGKSTLIRTIAGVQQALCGEISICNVSLAKLQPKKRSSFISMVFTDPPASGNLNVWDLVALGRYPHTNWIGSLTEKDTRIIQNCIQQLDLTELSQQFCHTLSDGQLQRALIARALAQDTPVMLLDEPTSHLDLYHKVKIFEILKSIASTTDKTLVFTTHEIDLAIQLCDYILIIDQGTPKFGMPCQLISSGAFEQLFPKDLIRFNPDTGRFQVNK